MQLKVLSIKHKEKIIALDKKMVGKSLNINYLQNAKKNQLNNEINDKIND